MTFDPDTRDPGLAGERTDLAWDRSGLSLVAAGALILRGLGRPPLPSANVVVGVVVLLLGALVSFGGTWHARHRRRMGARVATTADLLPLTVAVVLIGVAAFAVSALNTG